MTIGEQIRRANIAPHGELEAIVQRIVEKIHPEKIVLFGSAARGGARPPGDLDLLVIKSGNYHHIEMAQRI